MQQSYTEASRLYLQTAALDEPKDLQPKTAWIIEPTQMLNNANLTIFTNVKKDADIQL